MILLIAVVAGLVGGWLRARLSGRPFVIPPLRRWWLAPLAFVPQYIAFYSPVTRSSLPQYWVAIALVSSQALLLLFVWHNRRDFSFWIMGAGLVMNLTVIGLNGGLMPIAPDTLGKLYLEAPANRWQVGSRVGQSKNVLLPAAETRLEWLADRFFLPSWIPYQIAYSLGDVLIAFGAFLFLWQAGGPRPVSQE